MEATYRVEGMTCGGCVKSVTNALQKLGVDVDVSLDAKTATVRGPGPIDEQRVKDAIEAAGFEFRGPVSSPP